MAKKKEQEKPAKEKEEVVDTPEVSEEAPKKATKGDSFPKVDGNGRFQAVPFKDGFVVFNPRGQRATGVISEVRANDLVRRSNYAIGIKG